VPEQHSRAFDPALALRVLNRHGVRFVLIGGLAGNVLGSPSLTFDLDICYARDSENLDSLSAALTELHAELRGVDLAVPFKLDARSLRMGDSFTFNTDAGALDVLGTPSGTSGYEDLRGDATEMELAGVRVWVTSLTALMRMKQAAGRAKDRVELEILAALKDEIENGGATR
jgi:predicted nucleotidyltransferase